MTSLVLPGSITEIFTELRQRIRGYLLLRGTALAILTMILIYASMLTIDTVWFSFTRLELPVTLRVFVNILAILILLVTIGITLIWPLSSKLSNRSLTHLLEQKFPHFQDRLITSVEMMESPSPEQTDLSRAMLARTITQASEQVRTVNVRELLNYTPLRFALTLATVVTIVFTSATAASPDSFRRWYTAFVELKDDYWIRQNHLEFFVITQPGDRLVPFLNREIKHARGTDLTLLAQTTTGQAPTQVYLKYQSADEHTGRAVMTQSGEGKFRHTIGNVISDLKITVTGGDFTTRIPLTVRTVDEPTIQQMAVTCLYPEYTGWNNPATGRDQSFSIKSTELSLPAETEFQLQATSSKPISRCLIEGQGFRLIFKNDENTALPEMTLMTLSDQGGIESTTQIDHQANGFHLSSDQTQIGWSFRIVQAWSEHYQADESHQILLPMQEELKFYLTDQDQVSNLEPYKLAILGIEDQVPMVETKLKGIGQAITRKATLPFYGDISDDYGLEQIQFEYFSQKRPELNTIVCARQPEQSSTMSYDGSEDEPESRFDILNLDFEVDDVLTLTQLATDQDHLNGPHVGRSQTYRLKVVSDQELLSLLYDKELNLRRRFEQILTELKRARDDFDTVTALFVNSESDNPGDEVTDSAQRTLNILLKDAIECDSICLAFSDILEELLNNRIDTPQTRERLQFRIIEPLRSVIGSNFPETENSFRELSVPGQPTNLLNTLVSQADQNLNTLVSELEQILLEMRKLESFQELVEQLKGIIEDEKTLRKKTEEERRKKLIDLLN